MQKITDSQFYQTNERFDGQIRVGLFNSVDEKQKEETLKLIQTVKEMNENLKQSNIQQEGMKYGFGRVSEYEFNKKQNQSLAFRQSSSVGVRNQNQETVKKLEEEFDKIRSGQNDGIVLSDVKQNSYDNLIMRMRTSTFKVRNVHAMTDIVEPMLLGMSILHKKEMEFKSSEKWENFLYQRKLIEQIVALRQDGTKASSSLLLRFQQFMRQPWWFMMANAAKGVLNFTKNTLMGFLFGRRDKSLSVQQKILEESKKTREFMMTGQVDQTRGLFDRIMGSGVLGLGAKGLGALVGIRRGKAQEREDRLAKGEKAGGGITGALSSFFYDDIVSKGRVGGIANKKDTTSLVKIENLDELAQKIAEAIGMGFSNQSGLVIEGEFKEKKDGQKKSIKFLDNIKTLFSFFSKSTNNHNSLMLNKIEDSDFILHKIETNTRKLKMRSAVSDAVLINEARQNRFFSQISYREQKTNNEKTLFQLEEMKKSLAVIKSKKGKPANSGMGIGTAMIAAGAFAVAFLTSGLKNIVRGVWQLISWAGRKIWKKVIFPLGLVAYRYIAKKGKAAWDFAKEKSKIAWDFTKKHSVAFWEYTKSVASKSWDSVKGYGQKAYNFLDRQIKKIDFDSVKERVKGFGDAISYGKDRFSDFISKMPILSTVLKGAADLTKRAGLSDAKKDITDAFNKTIDLVTERFYGFGGSLDNATIQISNSVSSFVDSTKDTFSTAWDSTKGFFGGLRERVNRNLQGESSERIRRTVIGAGSGALTAAIATKNPYAILGGAAIGGTMGFSENSEESSNQGFWSNLGGNVTNFVGNRARFASGIFTRGERDSSVYRRGGGLSTPDPVSGRHGGIVLGNGGRERAAERLVHRETNSMLSKAAGLLGKVVGVGGLVSGLFWADTMYNDAKAREVLGLAASDSGLSILACAAEKAASGEISTADVLEMIGDSPELTKSFLQSIENFREENEENIELLKGIHGTLVSMKESQETAEKWQEALMHFMKATGDSDNIDLGNLGGDNGTIFSIYNGATN